ncbi:hypothetical protein AK830_g10643 [Neonectria ditissima]|uniref:Uncharacterized protein n=1 Tax=Neonectria ditissima TaxID=78410 RepID=A0A0P7BA24_9HYPO|nr:hypothetical protein AK830_g10643 [Neonectria ditissima]
MQLPPLIVAFCITTATASHPSISKDCCGWDEPPIVYPRMIPRPEDVHSAPKGPDPDDYALGRDDPAYAWAFLSTSAELDTEERLRLSLSALSRFPEKAGSLLSFAIEDGHPSVVSSLLEAGASATETDEDGTYRSSPLAAACRLGDVESLRLFVEAGADPDLYMAGLSEQDLWHVSGSRATPLMIAIQYGQAEVVDYLLGTERVDLTRRQPYRGVSPIEMAAAKGDLPTLRALMEHPSQEILAIAKEFEERNPFYELGLVLRMAVSSGKIEAVQYLLKNMGIPSEDRDGVWKGDLLTPGQRRELLRALKYACSTAQTNSIELLLGYFLRPGESTFPELEGFQNDLVGGRMKAVYEGQTEAYELLMHLEAQRGVGERPQEESDFLQAHLLRCLQFAAAFGSLGIVKHLVENQGLDVNDAVTGTDERSGLPLREPIAVLDHACQHGTVDVVRYLLEHTTADIHGSLSKAGYWRTPLSRAMANRVDGSAEAIARLLLEHGGPVDLISPDGTPEFKNNDVVVDVIAGNSLGERNSVCLCWGYKSSIRPIPNLPHKNAVRLELGEGDQTWWSNLQYVQELQSTAEGDGTSPRHEEL